MFSKKNPYTLESHRDHLNTLIEEMNQDKTEPTNNEDAENAKNQLNFAIDMRNHINEMLALSFFNINAKTKLGEKMRLLTTQYFNVEEVPAIQGEKSRGFALKIAKHYLSFTKVQFNSLEEKASVTASALGIFNIISIPDQVAHHAALAEKITSNVEAYDQCKKTATILQ